MAKQIKQRQLPTGISRLFFRAPIWLYRLGLGGLFGNRALLLNHIGRKSGLPRQAVLEVVIHEEETNIYFVNAGFGPKTQWYQNLKAQPNASIQVGWKKWNVCAEILTSEQSGDVFRRFAAGHNKMVAAYARGLGYEVDGTLDDYEQMGKLMIFVALRPR